MNEINYNQDLANKITPREKQIVDHMIQGKTNGQIADQLGIKLNTVEAHRRNLFKKLGCANAAEVVAKLFRGGILL